MANFDLPLAETPKLTALEQSYAVDDIERELKALFLRLFRELLADTAYDVNVTGAAHLGSFDFIRKVVNADGLAILQGDREEEATRYLYRAWKSRDVNGRGTFFLRTYLQMLFPNLCEVAQLWQVKDEPYPFGLHSALDTDVKEGLYVISPETHWLTSRVEIALDLTVATRSITTLTNIFRAILPARLVPQFHFWLIFDTSIEASIVTDLLMQKYSTDDFDWGPLILWNIGDKELWYLENDEEQAIPLIGWRIEGSANLQKAFSAQVPSPSMDVVIEIV